MATMAKPNALAMPRRLTAVGPDPMPPTTAAPQPKNTSANVPMNSATCLFTVHPLCHLPKNQSLLSTFAPAWKGQRHISALLSKANFQSKFLRLPANSGIENLELFSGAQFVKKGGCGKAPSTWGG